MLAKITKGNTDKFNTRIRSLSGLYTYSRSKGLPRFGVCYFYGCHNIPIQLYSHSSFIHINDNDAVFENEFVACIQGMGFNS
jgi:hypothetical protein